jgi:two-component system LytT family sensor kinase
MSIILNSNRFIRNTILLILLVAAMLSILYFNVYQPENDHESLIRIIYGLIMTAGLWGGCIIIVSFLWKKFPWQESPLKHLFIEVFAIFAYTIIYSFLVYTLTEYFFQLDFEGNILYEAFNTILITFFITALHESVFFYRQWTENFSKSIKLEKENIEANYEALKANLNPHFLFNSLNSLSNLVDDNPKATEYISNLSDFLRYLLKNDEKELVELHEELEVLQKYIILQKLRFEEALIVNLDIIHPESYVLPPLVLQILVENSIKHNEVSSEKPLIIEISNDDQYIFIKNNKNTKLGVDSTGVGLQNIIDRYKLFTSLSVEIESTNDSFSVKVPVISIKS